MQEKRLFGVEIFSIYFYCYKLYKIFIEKLEFLSLHSFVKNIHFNGTKNLLLSFLIYFVNLYLWTVWTTTGTSTWNTSSYTAFTLHLLLLIHHYYYYYYYIKHMLYGTGLVTAGITRLFHQTSYSLKYDYATDLNMLQ